MIHVESFPPTIMGDEELLTERQVYQEFGFRPKTLQAKRLRGGGPEFVKIGAAVRYQRRSIRCYIKEHAVCSTSEVAARTESHSAVIVDSSTAVRTPIPEHN